MYLQNKQKRALSTAICCGTPQFNVNGLPTNDIVYFDNLASVNQITIKSLKTRIFNAEVR